MDSTYFQIVLGVLSLAIAIYTIRRQRKAVVFFICLFIASLGAYYFRQWLTSAHHSTDSQNIPDEASNPPATASPQPIKTDVTPATVTQQTQAQPVSESTRNPLLKRLTFTLLADVNR